MPSRSSGTCGRFSRSSIAIGRSSSSRARSGAPAASKRRRARRAADRACHARSACSTRTSERLAREVGRGHHHRVRQPALARQTFQHRGGILDRAEERAAVDAPSGLARTDRQQPLDLQGTAADPRPAHAGTGRCPRRRRPPAPTEYRGEAAGECAATPMAPAAIGDPRRAEQHQQRQGIHDREGGIAGCRACHREHEGEQGGTDHAGPRHREQVVDPGKAPELPWQPERQSCQQQCRRTRCAEAMADAASRRTDRPPRARAEPPTPPGPHRLRCSERFARVGALPWQCPIAHPAKASQMPNRPVKSRSKGRASRLSRRNVSNIPFSLSPPDRFWSILAGSSRLGGNSCRSSLRAFAQGNATAGEDRCRAVHG